jgi:hypothetical protein
LPFLLLLLGGSGSVRDLLIVTLLLVFWNCTAENRG